MKRRIRYIFILMTTCILGINIFQGYWLYTTYTLHTQQFTRTAMETLLVSLQKWQEMDADRLLRNTDERPLTIYRESRDVKPGQETRMLYEKVDSANRELEKEVLARNKAVNVIQFRRELPAHMKMELVPADTLARRISSRLIVNWISNSDFNLPKMDSTFRAELRLRDMDALFKLDTIHPVTVKEGKPVFSLQRGRIIPYNYNPFR
jgi:hypothetical protein